MSDVLFGSPYSINGVLYFPISYVLYTDGSNYIESVLSFVPLQQKYVVLPLDYWHETFPEITKQ